ncbi:MAG: FixH family protein [Chiayiivirga sp.]|uniref:FixH family protein n=1 Tax=Chiayiivirga sp. TaxID=2041042 RepID=UPI0025C5AD21|nr:FixH family protein [Chiayiivirga sp.]MCI1728928.1 FixH family protein [Chiayiivirga sp.]
MSPVMPRHALREPMVWLVVALPLAAVIAGITTLVLALRSGGADAVPAEVRRTAQIQVEDVAADQRALRDGLSASLVVDRQTGALELRLSPAPTPTPVQLQLHLAHPQRADADLELRLVQSGAGWHGRIEPRRAHAWNLRLMPADSSWRLVGRIEPDASQVELHPALRD